MKSKDILNLKKGDFVVHKRFGLCIVYQLERTLQGDLFGLAIRPLTMEGMFKLAVWSKTYFNTFLENSVRQILRKVEDPIIPLLLIFEGEKRYKVARWKELGEVSSEGKVNGIVLKKFNNLQKAKEFINEDMTRQIVTPEIYHG